MKADRECDRLNSFLMIDGRFNFEKDYLKAKDNAPYYFSRDEKKIMFPALAVSLVGTTQDDYKNSNYQMFCHTIDIGVVDQRIINCDNCKGCDARGIEQIYLDAANLLRKTINTISNYKLFKVTKDGVDSYLYGQEDVINLKLEEEVYDAVREITKETEIYNKRFSQKNQTLTLSDVERPVMNIYMKWTTITICEICTNEEQQFSYKTFKGCC